VVGTKTQLLNLLGWQFKHMVLWMEPLWIILLWLLLHKNWAWI